MKYVFGFVTVWIVSYWIYEFICLTYEIRKSKRKLKSLAKTLRGE